MTKQTTTEEEHLSPAELSRLYADKKHALKEAQTALDEVHAQIIKHPDVIAAMKAKPSGSSTVANCIKISPGVTKIWNQEKLAELEKQVASEFWPFEQVYKEDAAAMKVFKERFPDLYSALSPALSTKPKKTSVEAIS